jgi:hypothetical protein
MNAWLIALTGSIYLYVSASAAFDHRWGFSIMYFGYAFANVGAYLMETRGSL